MQLDCISPFQVCWRCEASKGTLDLNYAYTNVNDNAAWRSTEWTTLPWQHTPELSLCRGFSIKMLAVDLLHAFHLGCGRDLLGSALKVLVKQRYFPGTNIEKSLSHASLKLKRFAKSRGLSLTLSRLSKQNLMWVSDAYPELKCKGFDTYIVLSWLVEETSQSPPVSAMPDVQVALNEMCTCLWAADSWVGMLAHADMFLTEQQQCHKEVVGSIFLSMYISLAGRSLHLRERYWRTRPKFHLLDHVIKERRASRLNADVNSTWMDEDWVKRVMRTKKGTHKRTACEKSLRRWILGLGPKMVDALSKLR